MVAKIIIAVVVLLAIILILGVIGFVGIYRAWLELFKDMWGE